MPEGPEIHGQALRLQSFLQGQRPQIACHYPPLTEALKKVEGQRLIRVQARGKAFLLTFESDLTLYAHMQLYGRWLISKSPESPKSNRTLRLSLRASSHSAWLYSATDLEVLSPEQIQQHAYLSRLGPDLLDPTVDPMQLLRRLQEPRFQRRRLAALLLDQNFWAGPGNYLRSEILFCTGLSPETRPCDLSLQQAQNLVKVSQGLAKRSLQTGGITNHPDIVSQQKRAKVPRRLYRHWVFARQGQNCWLCQSPIIKEEWGGRRLYRCCGCGGGGTQSLEIP
jgi:endonuclease-8